MQISILLNQIERASLNLVGCLEAPLSINQTSKVSGGDAAERADTRMNSFLLLSTTLDSSYLEFLDLLKGCPFQLQPVFPLISIVVVVVIIIPGRIPSIRAFSSICKNL